MTKISKRVSGNIKKGMYFEAGAGITVTAQEVDGVFRLSQCVDANGKLHCHERVFESIAELQAAMQEEAPLYYWRICK